MKLTNEQINKLAADVLGVEYCNGRVAAAYDSDFVCLVCDRHMRHDIHSDFCTDLNAAQRLVKEVACSRMGRYELSGAVGYLLFGERDYPSDTDIADALLLPAKTITLAALVAAEKISIEDAKESL